MIKDQDIVVVTSVELHAPVIATARQVQHMGMIRIGNHPIDRQKLADDVTNLTGPILIPPGQSSQVGEIIPGEAYANHARPPR